VVIRLRDIQCYAYHGVLEEEKQQGNTFRVNVAITIDNASKILIFLFILKYLL
jgi:dihydroneopterin aldolase